MASDIVSEKEPKITLVLYQELFLKDVEKRFGEVIHFGIWVLPKHCPKIQFSSEFWLEIGLPVTLFCFYQLDPHVIKVLHAVLKTIGDILYPVTEIPKRL